MNWNVKIPARTAAGLGALVALAVFMFMFVTVATKAPPTPTATAEKWVTICHKPGTPAEKTMNVPQSAVNGHQGHGDYLGECQATSIPVPTEANTPVQPTYPPPTPVQTTWPTATQVPPQAPTNTPTPTPIPALITAQATLIAPPEPTYTPVYVSMPTATRHILPLVTEPAACVDDIPCESCCPGAEANNYAQADFFTELARMLEQLNDGHVPPWMQWIWRD